MEKFTGDVGFLLVRLTHIFDNLDYIIVVYVAEVLLGLESGFSFFVSYSFVEVVDSFENLNIFMSFLEFSSLVLILYLTSFPRHAELIEEGGCSLITGSFFQKRLSSLVKYSALRWISAELVFLQVRILKLGRGMGRTLGQTNVTFKLGGLKHPTLHE